VIPLSSAWRIAIASTVIGSSALAIGAACGAPRLDTPSYTEQPTSALGEVPFPPPPARVEEVPKQPNDSAVWVDGEWIWQGRRWAWKPGRWVVPPPNARFAPWTSVRDRVGTLYLATGTWRDSSGNDVPEPDPVAIAHPAPAAIVNPEGEDVPRGPNVRLDAGTFGHGRDDLDAAATQAALALDAAIAPLSIVDAAATSTDASTEHRMMDGGREKP
jgi:hypothetical protein